MTPDSPLVDAVLASPNHNERRVPGGPDMLIIHYTGMGTGDDAVRWLCDPVSAVSCHYLVHEDGRIVQMVPEARRAWHAGAGDWRGQADINSRSIGIEIVNLGHEYGYPDFSDVQIRAVVQLCADCATRWAIPPERLLGHSDVAPARKADPGEKFPWDQLFSAGLGHLVEASPITGGRFFGLGDKGEPVAAYQGLLAAYGYGVPIDGTFGETTRQATIAFQRHFRRERVDGIADASTVETLHRLLMRLPRSPFRRSVPTAQATTDPLDISA
nr:N-acetylmuramoyl-L-alanine amidase [Aurantimonas aggregata]